MHDRQKIDDIYIKSKGLTYKVNLFSNDLNGIRKEMLFPDNLFTVFQIGSCDILIYESAEKISRDPLSSIKLRFQDNDLLDKGSVFTDANEAAFLRERLNNIVAYINKEKIEDILSYNVLQGTYILTTDLLDNSEIMNVLFEKFEKASFTGSLPFLMLQGGLPKAENLRIN